MKIIKHTETIEHQGLETPTGDPVQQAIRYFKKVNTHNEQ